LDEYALPAPASGSDVGYGLTGYQQPEYVASNILSLADAKDFGTALRASTLGRGTAILESDLLWILDLPLRPTFEAISFHKFTSLGSK
jgi:hypothetical protein